MTSGSTAKLSADKIYFVWVKGPSGPKPEVWHNGQRTSEGKPVPFLAAYEITSELAGQYSLDALASFYPLMTTKVPSEQINKVTLIDWTGAGSPDRDYAVNILLFTKNTRLNMTVGGVVDVATWSPDQKYEQLKYMTNTNPGSWEFVDYTFLIERVTRAFTHQLVRTRHASYAQQTMRVLDVSTGPGWEYLTGPSIKGNDKREKVYNGVMDIIAHTYKEMIVHGAEVQDARGILPTNILTNIVMKCNMRTFIELCRKRVSPRVQDEYRTVLEGMKMAVRRVHPWIDLFINRTFDQAAADLDNMIMELFEDNTIAMSKERKTVMLKLVDQMRQQS